MGWVAKDMSALVDSGIKKEGRRCVSMYTQKVLLGCGSQGGSCNGFHFLSEIKGYYPPRMKKGETG